MSTRPKQTKRANKLLSDSVHSAVDPARYVHAQNAEDFLKTLPDETVHLLAIDPPYFNVATEKWDRQWNSVKDYAEWLVCILNMAYSKLTPDASIVMFGAIGKHGERPLFEVMRLLEASESPYFYRNMITWKKRRAYGKSHDYLFCREEIVWYSVSKERTRVRFNIPLTNTKRGYTGFRKKAHIGTVELCYHPSSAEKISQCVCMSPGAQASSKRLVLAMLHSMEGCAGPGVSGQKSEIQSELLQARTEQEATTGGTEAAERQGSCVVGIPETEDFSQEQRNTIRVDRERLARSLDGYVSSFGSSNTGRGRRSGIQNLSRPGRQLCWVCTWEYSSHLFKSQSNQKRRISLGIRASCRVHTHIRQRIEVTESRVVHRAKSDFLRVSNVWTDIPELMRPDRACEKPVALMRRIVETHSYRDDLVVDLFAGLGTTGVACAESGRQFLGCDRDEQAAKRADQRVRAAFEKEEPKWIVI